jgi:hypothetical protein
MRAQGYQWFSSENREEDACAACEDTTQCHICAAEIDARLEA